MISKAILRDVNDSDRSWNVSFLHIQMNGMSPTLNPKATLTTFNPIIFQVTERKGLKRNALHLNLYHFHLQQSAQNELGFPIKMTIISLKSYMKMVKLPI